MITEIELDKLKELSIEEHARLVVELCDKIEPCFNFFEARLKYERPSATDLVRQSDYAQLFPRMMRREIIKAFPTADPFF